MRLRRKVARNPDKPEVIKTVRNVSCDYVPAASWCLPAGRGLM